MASLAHGAPQSSTPTCPICGSADTNLAGVGPMKIIPASNYSLLKALSTGEFDEYTCPARHKRPDLTPTVMVDLLDGTAMLSWGTLAAACKDVQNEFLHVVEASGRQVALFDSLDSMRMALTKRATAMIEEVLAASGELKKQSPESRKKLLDKFPSSYFAISALVMTVPLPALNIQFPPGQSMENVLQSVVYVQVMVWIALCASWSSELEPGRTLEGEFARVLDPQALIHAAGDEFLRVTDQIQKENWTPMGHFCVEAIRASICHWRQRDNPHLREWADLFVKQEVTRTIAAQECPPHLIAMEVSAERARNTIPYEALFDACARLLAELGVGCLEAIDAIGKKLNYRNLGAQLVSSVQPIQEEGTGEKKVPVDELVRILGEVGQKREPDSIWLAAEKMITLLEEGTTPESLTRMTDGLVAVLGNDPEIHGRGEQWLCSQLLKHRFVRAALERIGEQPQSWEAALPPELRARLSNERSNALRAAGRGAEAIAAAEAVQSILNEAGLEASPEARLNLGILCQEHGRQQEALAIFSELLASADRDGRLRALQSIATTYISLGRFSEALPHLEEAASLARGPLRGSRTKVLVSLAALQSVTGHPAEALATLRGLSPEDCDEVSVLGPWASAWINLSQKEGLLQPSDRKKMSEMVGVLAKARKRTSEAGDWQMHLHVVRILAVLADLSNTNRQEVFWQLLDTGAREFEGSPDPMALLALARHHWAADDRAKAKSLMMELPDAVAARFGPEQDSTLKIDSLHSLRRYFDHIGGLAIRSGPLEDVRFVAEAQRDLFGRIRAAQAGAGREYGGLLVAPDAAMVAQIGGPAAVLEWLDTIDGVVGLATFIGADGEVSTTDLGDPGVDLDILAERVRQRLSVWHEDRKGDPFDLPEWRTFTEWVHQTLDGHLADGGHLVVLEHPEVWGLEWHVAAAPRWRTSYAPSWSALLAKPQTNPDLSTGPLGVVMVTKFRDSSQVLSALEQSVESARALAASVGREFESRVQVACDRESLLEMLERCAVAKLLCHGFVDRSDKQVALMVSADGALPLADSVFGGTPQGRRHRFGWKECQALKHAPAVVFSAACSSGRAHAAGLGERLGIYTILRRAGTRSFVAPRWDIKPAAVLPILDDAMTRHLRGGEPLGEALHNACIAASASQPRWLAWALALEGDWK